MCESENILHNICVYNLNGLNEYNIILFVIEHNWRRKMYYIEKINIIKENNRNCNILILMEC